MSLEIGSVESDEFDIYYSAGFFRDQNTGLSDIEHRIQKVAQMNPMGAGGNVEVRVEASWGGKDGGKVSVGASGEVHDNEGNYAKGDAKQDIGGEGTVSISAGHKDQDKDQ